MDFKEEKLKCLSAVDKSKEGKIDKEVIPLINLINSNKDYYTTSSCAGRITLIEIPKSNKKNETNWLLKKHSLVNLDEIKNALKNVSKNPLWFRQEGLILHVCCKDLKKAKILLNIARDCGFKRAGIIAHSKRFVVEIASTEKLDAIIAKENKVLVDDNYLKELINESNLRLSNNKKKGK